MICVGSLLLLLSGCSKNEIPENDMPILTTGEAIDIGRKTATLFGHVSVPSGSEVLSCGFMYSTVSSLPDSESEKIPVTLKGTSETYTITLTELSPNTTYYYCLYASSGYTEIRSETASFTTATDGVPALESVTYISSTETSLTIASQIVDDGGSDILKYGFAYRQANSQESERMVEASAKQPDGRYTFTLSGLSSETDYEVRSFATNAKGTGYGEAATLSTSAPELPILTLTIKETRSSSVEVIATIDNENNLSETITEAGFCWSTTNEEPTINDNKQIVTLDGNTLKAQINGLEPNTQYTIRAYAVNKKTQTGYSSAASFTTQQSSVPLMGITEIVAVDVTSTTLKSTIKDKGGHDITKLGFAYKIGNGTETQVEIPLDKIQEDGSFEWTITGLAPETAYEVRAYALNEKGVGYGESTSFTTAAIAAPQLSLETGTIESTSVSVTAIIQSAGESSSVIRETGFCWSETNPLPQLTDNKLTVTAEEVSFSAILKGLKPETKYYIRAYAINEVKAGYSNVAEITTPVSNIPGEDDIVSPDKE